MTKKAIYLHSGDKLVGEVFQKTDEAYKIIMENNPMFQAIFSGQDVIIVKRDGHYSFLNKEAEVKAIRDAKKNEQEELQGE